LQYLVKAKSQGAWAGQRLAAALAENPRAHGAAVQWLRTVCHTCACAPRRCLSTALTQPRLPRRCLAKCGLGAVYGTSSLPLRPRCAPARRCAPHASGQGCCRRWRELGRVCEDCAARAAQARCAARRVGVGQIKSARLLAKPPLLPAAHTSGGSGGGSGVGSGRGRAASTALAAVAAPAAVAAAGGANAAGMLGAARPAPMMPHDGAFSQLDIGGATSRRRQWWGGGSRQEKQRTRRGRRWRVSARSRRQRGGAWGLFFFFLRCVRTFPERSPGFRALARARSGALPLGLRQPRLGSVSGGLSRRGSVV